MRLGPKNKREFYALFGRGAFGNKGLMWNSLEAFRQSGYSAPVAIRTGGVGTRCDYHIPAKELPKRYREFLEAGWKPNQLNISAMMPDEKIVMQGEVCRNVRGLDLWYSEVKRPMRVALAEGGKRLFGLQATALLKSRMDADSFEWLNELLDTYHKDSGMSSVVEFSVYSIPVGELQGRNTIFWEVRNY